MRSGKLLNRVGRIIRGWQREYRQLVSLMRTRLTRRNRRLVVAAGFAAIIGMLLLTRFPSKNLPLHDNMERAVARVNPAIEVYFSPRGGCTNAILKEIGNARSTILVQAYSFTSRPIAKALFEARRRGVHVEVILDASRCTEKYSEADFLVHMGISTWFDAKHAIAHNKVMVIDGATVITGSFNFTKAAEDRNAENLLVICDKALAEKYTANWKVHAEHSEEYRGRGVE